MKFLTPVIIVALIILGKTGLYILPEHQQAIITQFGKPVGEPIKEPGLHLKTPFLHEVTFIEKRILTWDGYPNEIPTKDKKYISVDTTARWKITDPLLFLTSLRTEREAKRRLDTILDAITRDTISGNNLVEVVRNSDDILNKVQVNEDGVEDSYYSDLEPIKVGREKLSEIIALESNKELKKTGIEVVDVQFRRISYEQNVEKKVYDRMISERQRIAERIRSVGKGEKAKIQGQLGKELQKIESEAYKKSQEIKGAGEAKAIKIYAEAIKSSPDFFEFMRSMEAYKNTFKDKSKFILSSDSEFLKYFKKL